MSRQNYYKQRKLRERRSIDEEAVIELVKEQRRHHPRLGVRKLHWCLSEEFARAGIEVGRDRLFEILREREMLVPRLPRSPRTTNSRHSLPVYGNLLKGMTTTEPNQAWVSDITYIRTLEGFEYLSLIMDQYSSKVVGDNCSEDLKTESSLKALDEALASLPEGCKPIHHSDRGSQYCSHAYINRLRENGLKPSMTEENHCAENAKAERLNGRMQTPSEVHSRAT